jgi:hypothetical protein
MRADLLNEVLFNTLWHLLIMRGCCCAAWLTDNAATTGER